MEIIVLLLVFRPWILTGFSTAFTLLHTTDELITEGGPIWRYLRLPVSDPVGFLGLVAFGLAQIALAFGGYVGGHRWALWALLAVRLGDCVVSHWWPWIRGRRPNPGIITSALYALEVVAISILLSAT